MDNMPHARLLFYIIPYLLTKSWGRGKTALFCKRLNAVLLPPVLPQDFVHNDVKDLLSIGVLSLYYLHYTI